MKGNQTLARLIYENPFESLDVIAEYFRYRTAASRILRKRCMSNAGVPTAIRRIKTPRQVPHGPKQRRVERPL